MGYQDTLLQSFNVLRTQELDEARAAVTQRYCDHHLDLVSDCPVDVVHNHVRGTHVSLNMLEYGADVSIDPGELKDFYLLQLPLTGSAEIIHRGEVIDANRFCGTLLNPDRPTQMMWRGDCRKLMVQIDAVFLTRIAVEEAGADLPGPVRFDPKVCLTTEAGGRLRALSLAAAQSIDKGNVRLVPQDLTLLALERQLAVTMLETQPSNVSHFLRSPRQKASGFHLRRAIAYIHAHCHESVGLEDIARASGLHHRTLQTAFRENVGVTPIQFLRDVRLDQARFHLLRRQNRASVSEIAYDCGYSHLGRFSRDFRARFGHSPSETS